VRPKTIPERVNTLDLDLLAIAIVLATGALGALLGFGLVVFALEVLFA
jgi:hypothetical protein